MPTSVPAATEQHAGLTPGAVYRRFRDKDKLLEPAILGILERQDERLKEGMTKATAAKIPLDVFAAQIVGGMVFGSSSSSWPTARPSGIPIRVRRYRWD